MLLFEMECGSFRVCALGANTAFRNPYPFNSILWRETAASKRVRPSLAGSRSSVVVRGIHMKLQGKHVVKDGVGRAIRFGLIKLL